MTSVLLWCHKIALITRPYVYGLMQVVWYRALYWAKLLVGKQEPCNEAASVDKAVCTFIKWRKDALWDYKIYQQSLALKKNNIPVCILNQGSERFFFYIKVRKLTLCNAHVALTICNSCFLFVFLLLFFYINTLCLAWLLHPSWGITTNQLWVLGCIMGHKWALFLCQRFKTYNL